MANFNKSRVAKGGFSFGKLNLNYIKFQVLCILNLKSCLLVVDFLHASGGIVSNTMLVESKEDYSD